MKKKSPQKMRGSIPWGWLITITIVGVAVGLAVLFFPKPTAKSPPPTIVRAKIPPAPPVAPPPPALPAQEQTQPVQTDAPSVDSNATTAQDASPTPSVTTEGTLSAAARTPAEKAKPDQQEAASAPKAFADQPTDSAGSQTSLEQPSAKPSQDKADRQKHPSPPAPAAVKAPAMAPKPSKEVKAAAADTLPVQVDASKRQQEVTQQASERVSAEPTLPAPKGFAIQVGAYRNREYADAQVAELQKRGYVSYIYEVTDAQQRSFFLVRFGQFATREAAAESVADFMEKEKKTAVIVRAGAM